ncbi:unnamed protein product, partial [Brassica rapa]
MQSRGSTRAATEPPSPGDNTEKGSSPHAPTTENQSQDLPVSGGTGRTKKPRHNPGQAETSRAELESVAVTPDLSPQEPSLTDPPRMETRLEAARTEQGLRQRPQRGGDEPVEQRGKRKGSSRRRPTEPPPSELKERGGC